jgi:hypothetical protein
MPAYGAILLGEVARHLAAVHICCNFCPRRGKASVGRLMQEHGPDMAIPICCACSPTIARDAWLPGSPSRAVCTCRSWGRSSSRSRRGRGQL